MQFSCFMQLETVRLMYTKCICEWNVCICEQYLFLTQILWVCSASCQCRCWNPAKWLDSQRRFIGRWNAWWWSTSEEKAKTRKSRIPRSKGNISLDIGDDTNKSQKKNDPFDFWFLFSSIVSSFRFFNFYTPFILLYVKITHDLFLINHDSVDYWVWKSYASIFDAW